jgi:hypothetical protein
MGVNKIRYLSTLQTSSSNNCFKIVPAVSAIDNLSYSVEEFHNLYPSLNIIGMTKSRMR